jgi:hypothetical protein
MGVPLPGQPYMSAKALKITITCVVLAAALGGLM